MRVPVDAGVRAWRLSTALALVLSACAGGETSDGGGTATFGPATPTSPPSSTAAATAGGDSSSPSGSNGESDSDDGDDSDSAEDDASEGSATDDPTATDGSSTDTESESDSAPPPSEQPVDGMYSDCRSAVECIGLTTCMTILDAGGEISDGFCTVGACMNAAASCDPAPGGTAQPFCFPIEQDGNADHICALDCSAGAQCPAGMECFELSAGSICA